MRSPLTSSSTSLPHEIGAPVIASAARRKSGPAGSHSPRSSYPWPLSRRWRSESAAYQAAPTLATPAGQA